MRIKKILATMPHEAHEQQVKEIIDILSELPGRGTIKENWEIRRKLEAGLEGFEPPTHGTGNRC